VKTPFLTPVRYALNGVHAPFVIGQAPARRYPPELAPFAVIDDMSEPILKRLKELPTSDERVYIFSGPPALMDGLSVGPPLHTLQMLGPEALPTVQGRKDEINPILMTPEDAGEMFELITLAFPGFYQPRTYETGTYYGIRVD
jgi:hypothetical protein